MRKKLLLVEDEPSIVELLIDRANFHNLDCDTAASGEEALEKLKNSPPTLVILDLMLPKMSGLGVLREMRNSPTMKNIPVLILTALNQEKVAREAMDLGAKAFFVKTGNMNDLFKLIQEYIR
ncbi:MAG: response regulator [Deltaproteobacteria bacterium]|nr:response regulator [Deltaproteobacteria bacterium]